MQQSLFGEVLQALNPKPLNPKPFRAAWFRAMEVEDLAPEGMRISTFWVPRLEA